MTPADTLRAEILRIERDMLPYADALGDLGATAAHFLRADVADARAALASRDASAIDSAIATLRSHK